MFRVEKDLFWDRDGGWYYRKREFFTEFLKSDNEFMMGFFTAFYLVMDFCYPSSSVILTPWDMPLTFSMLSMIECAFYLNNGAYLKSFL